MGPSRSLVRLYYIVLLVGIVFGSPEWGVYIGGQYFAQQQQTQGGGGNQQGGGGGGGLSVPLNGLSEYIDGRVNALGNGGFTSGLVDCMVRNASSVLIGGSFQWTRCDPRSCHSASGFGPVLRNLAVFNFHTGHWSGLGEGCAGYVHDLSVSGSNIYVGGSLTQCFNDASIGAPLSLFVNNVAKWNASYGWMDLGGDDVSGEVLSLAYEPKSQSVYAIGRSHIHDVVVPFIFLQVFDGAAWNQLIRLSVSAEQNSFNVVRCYGDWVYVGGRFSQFLVPQETRGLVRFRGDDPFTIDTMDGGINGTVYDIASYGDGILVGGSFPTAGYPNSVEVNNIALWTDGKGWASLGTFHDTFIPSWIVYSLDTLGDGAVVAAGYFQNVSCKSASNGTTTASNSSLDGTGDEEIATASAAPCERTVSNIAVFNETSREWHPVGSVGEDGPLAPYTISAVVFTGVHEVVAYGNSERFGENVIASYLEMGAGAGWVFEKQALLETGFVACGAWSPQYGYVFAGIFSSNGNSEVRSLAIWNTTTQQVSQLGSGLYGSVNSVAFLGDVVYFTGAVSLILDGKHLQGEDTLHYFGRYNFITNTYEFPPLPKPNVYQTFHPLTCVHVVGDLVFVGGDVMFFSGDIFAFDHVVSQWRLVGPPNSTWSAGSSVKAMADDEGTHLWVAGNFGLTLAGDAGDTFYNLACLDILANEWVEFPRTCTRSADECLLETIHAIAVVQDSPQTLFIGGNFTFIGTSIRKEVNNVAQLSNGEWTAVGDGLAGTAVVSLATVNASIANLTLIAAISVATQSISPQSPVQVFSGGQWNGADPTWSWRVFEVSTVLVYYFEPTLSWPVYGVILLVAMCSLVLAGFIVVGWMMRKQRMGKRDYALLDPTVGVGQDGTSSDWLIDYESLTIFNPPIGKGSYSVVNRAVLKGTVVAVKTFMGNDYFGDLKADFQHEIALLTRLRHPNIILFIGACRSPLCIVTELAERGCLYDVIHQTPNEMTWTRIRSIALDSCRGLAYLHNQVPPILHRDLKSANVLIGKNFVAKISDFGIAKGLQINTMTQRVGTTRWTAPEVLRNKADASGIAYSLGSDVYSFGIIVWEMITLQLPWGHIPFDFQIEDHVIAGETLAIPDSTPQEYESLMRACWKFLASERPEFMQLINQLEAIPLLEGNPERLVAKQ